MKFRFPDFLVVLPNAMKCISKLDKKITESKPEQSGLWIKYSITRIEVDCSLLKLSFVKSCNHDLYSLELACSISINNDADNVS